MMGAIIFDMDGTLVQSEKLWAQSYAIAVQRLRSLPEPDQRVIEAYREIVGVSQDVASRHITDSLDLEPELRQLQSKQLVESALHDSLVFTSAITFEDIALLRRGLVVRPMKTPRPIR